MKRVLVLAIAAVSIVAGALPAAAGPIPTTPCEIQDFLGYDNVKECEDHPAS